MNIYHANNYKTYSKGNKVKAKPSAAKDLNELFEDGLKDIYWAERNRLPGILNCYDLN